MSLDGCKRDNFTNMAIIEQLLLNINASTHPETTALESYQSFCITYEWLRMAVK
jgi:hypothetical protein